MYDKGFLFENRIMATSTATGEDQMYIGYFLHILPHVATRVGKREVYLHLFNF